MAHNNEAPNQPPFLDAEAGHRDSTIKVYNLAQFASGTTDELMRVYTEGNLPGEMQQASLTTQVSQTEQGDLVMAMNFTLKLDGMTNGSRFLAKLQEYMLADRQSAYEVSQAYYRNALAIRTVYGLGLLARFDSAAGELVISNDTRFSAEGVEGVRVSPTPLSHNHMGADVQLIEMGRVMADILTWEPTEPGAYQGWPESRRGCLIEIGRDIRPLPSPSTRTALGRSATAGIRKTESGSQPERVSAEDVVRLSDIGGHESIIATFEEIALMFQKPEIAARHNVRLPRGVLLYGESGVGKTMLLEALANEMGAVIRRITSDEVYAKYVGESEANIRRIFDELRAAKVLTLALWDEFDTIVSVPDGDSGAEQMRHAVAGIFRQEMQRLGPNILVGATTNRRDKIHPSLLQDDRFDYRLQVARPDERARLAILGKLSSKYTTTEVADFTPEAVLEGVVSGSDTFDVSIDWGTLAKRTDGMTGSMIDGVFRRLKREKMLQEMRTGQASPITHADFMRTIAAVLSDSAG